MADRGTGPKLKSSKVSLGRHNFTKIIDKNYKRVSITTVKRCHFCGSPGKIVTKFPRRN